MTIHEWLRAVELTLKDITTARLDALVLLEDALGKDRSYILAHPEEILDKKVVQLLDKQIERRAKHEPLAYIRGKSEFYGREFMVSANTLEPRPETETMIDQLKKLPVAGTVCDVGTGSGCIAITVKLELPNTTVLGTEINDKALEIAKKNAAHHKVDVMFYSGNLLGPVSDQIEVLLCNLPYVPDSHTINQAAMHEPKIAIFGGADGLDLYRKLFLQIEKRDQKPKYILTESLPFQHHGLASIARNYGYILQNTDDFIQLFELELP